MKLTYRCPACEQTHRAELTSETDQVSCPSCEWERPVTGADFEKTIPTECVLCDCPDLWRQKDFPQRLGILLVGCGALFSSIAWAMYKPVLAISILMGFALVDLLLFLFMRDVLVCYRCHARHSHDQLNEEHPTFDLEVAERYRQQELRLKETESSS